MRSAVLAIAAAALFAGCASTAPQTIQERVAGWPALRVYEHYVPHAEMQARCARYVVRYGARALACAEFDFSAGRCDIWYSADLGPRPALIRHERLHCAGYDHPGEDAMARMLAEWERRHVFSGRFTAEPGRAGESGP